MAEALNALDDDPEPTGSLAEYDRELRHATRPQVAADPNRLLRLLLVRDAVAAAAPSGRSVEEAARLVQLDETLRQRAADLSESLPAGRLEAWRHSFTPRPEAWWWRLAEVPAEIAERQSPWWPVATGIVLTISASLTADIARRFLSNGPDFYGALSTISQGAVTVLAGSSLTQTGRTWLNNWLRSFGISSDRSLRWYTFLAVCLLALVVTFRTSLPWIAIHHYDARGQRLFQDGKLHGAIEDFQRAISLAPEKDRPHFDLADTLEELLETDKAIGEYQEAIQLNPNFYQAYNNLARLYLVQRKDSEGALRALRKGFIRLSKEINRHPLSCATENEQCDALYTLHKNFAWVNVTMHWYRLARIDVGAAIQAHPQGTGIYCLLAQVEVAEKQNEAATKSWGKCLSNPAARQLLRGDERYKREDVEEAWIAMAMEWELSLKGGKP